MEKVLLNMANWSLIKFCGENQIDCSGSHIEKDGRGFKYSLVQDSTGRHLASIKFTKNSVPEYQLIYSWGRA